MLENNPVLKKVGIGCLIGLGIILLFAVIGGIKIYFDVKNAGGMDNYVRQKSAEELQYRINAAVDALPLNTPEKQSITTPVRLLAERMAKGDVSVKQSSLLVVKTFQSPAIEAIIALLFQNRNIDTKDEEAKLTVNRFVSGLLDGKISPTDAAGFLQLILTEPGILPEIRRGGDQLKQETAQKLKFKDNISLEDRNKCLELMKSAADRAAIPFARRDLNFTPVVTQIINQATAAAPVKK